MTLNKIHLLHIEDDRTQQAVVARYLSKLDEYQFEITTATSEDEAVQTFQQGVFELVVLDYQLNPGDGLSCLRRLRQLDPIVAVVAVSGVATVEIAGELITAGADDYLSKQTLDRETLCQSVRNALTRAKAFRSRFSTFSEPACSTASS